jgi:hypothetical protein
MRLLLLLIACFFAESASANDGDKVSLADAAQRAVEQSSLTSPNSKPFHLRATLAENGEPGSDYQAKIEEYWVSPKKWRRIIESPKFSQTLIQNDDRVFEKNTGDYYPHWLNTFITALFNPLPMLDILKKTDSTIPKSHGSESSTTCGDLHSKVDRWVICFEGSHGLLSSVFMKGDGAEFKEYKSFAGKRVARLITDDPEPGTKLELRITDLAELPQTDENLFAVSDSTPAKDRVRTVRVDEDTFRKLVSGNTDIEWPSVGEGLTTGGCAVFATAGRTGKVREVWPGGCDNAGLEDSLRNSVKQWQLKPAISEGQPVQVEALLGFTFHTTLDKGKSLPELSDAEVRDLAIEAVEPHFPPGAADKDTVIIINISVDETGKLTGAGPASNMPNALFLAAYNAIVKWKFRPYLKDGKPQYFHGKLAFRVK